MSRDVLAPPLMRMPGGRCYRVNLGSVAAKKTNPSEAREEKGYTEEDLYGADYDDEDGVCEVEELDSGVFKLAIHIPNAFYGGIIGFRGSTKKRIETETHTEIFVPRIRDGVRSNDRKDEITIKGKSREKILAARRQLNILTSSLRKRMRISHFIGVALKETPVQQKLDEFKNKVLAFELPGIDEELFMFSNCVHITIEACILLDDVERKKGVDLLQQSREYLVGLKTPFEVKVKNLEIMNDDPSAVNVLYASVDAPELQKYADKTAELFQKSGYAFDKFKRGSVKMHMTVMNSRYRKGVDKKTDKSFDAREILKKFGDFDFGSALCDEVFLLVLNTALNERQFYTVTGSIKL